MPGVGAGVGVGADVDGTGSSIFAVSKTRYYLTYLPAMSKLLPMAAYTSVVTSKGQLVIPAALRKRYGIVRGTMISFIEKDSALILQPITPRFVRKLRGSVSAKDRPNGTTRS